MQHSRACYYLSVNTLGYTSWGLISTRKDFRRENDHTYYFTKKKKKSAALFYWNLKIHKYCYIFFVVTSEQQILTKF